jgi:4-aminobutyrate aminotransferase/(S)-3-amino-2-methylpropionate transaminase
MTNLLSVPGPRSQALFSEETTYMAPGLQSIALFSEIVVHKAEGVYVTDIDGNTFIDINAGVAVGSVGHSHPHFVNIINDQLRRAAFGSFCTENRVEFLRILSSITPQGIDKIQMYSGGAEAVEAALRLAKSVTKKYEFAGFWGGFHGKTGGVLPLLGDTSFKKDLGPHMPGLYLAGPYAYCYRCFFKMTYPDCGFACVEFFRESLKRQSSHQIAGILIEPLQGTAGNINPPKGYVQAIKDVAKEFNALLIADEMITGFGRTGVMWGVDHDGVIPDIMTLGKGIGGGFPMSAIASNDKFTCAHPFSNPSGSSSSYGGNPLASAAGRAALEIILKENLVENSRRVGAFMKQKLQEFQERCSIIGDVRGQGLMIGLELVKDRKTKELLDKKLTRQLYHECLNRGLICMCYNPVVRINPPLIITKDEAEKALEIMIESLRAIERQMNKEKG